MSRRQKIPIVVATALVVAVIISVNHYGYLHLDCKRQRR